jgi:DNA-directed RNA polymerase specialized sigma24 family protein
VIRPGATWHRGIDLIAIERAMSLRGMCPALTDEEQRYAVEEMTAAEWSAEEIADRLGMSSRTVTRWRKELEGDGPS